MAKLFEIPTNDIQLNRFNSYNENYCWQYDIRLNNLAEDLELLPSGVDYTQLKVSDFIFKHISDDIGKYQATAFIRRHEWLGDIASNTTHYFGAYYKNILAGVVTMGNPVAYSNIMGKDTKEIERLISRGACISWSPKCLGSSFVMWCSKHN